VEETLVSAAVTLSLVRPDYLSRGVDAEGVSVEGPGNGLLLTRYRERSFKICLRFRCIPMLFAYFRPRSRGTNGRKGTLMVVMAFAVPSP